MTAPQFDPATWLTAEGDQICELCRDIIGEDDENERYLEIEAGSGPWQHVRCLAELLAELRERGAK